MNVCFSINRATDIPLAQILYLKKPDNVNMKIVASVFSHTDEYYWKKSKSLQIWLHEEDINQLQEYFGEDFTPCYNVKEFRAQFKSCQIGIFSGREPFIFKNICSKIVCLDVVGDYFHRYLDFLSIADKPENIKIVMNSRLWLERHRFRSSYIDTIKKHEDKFYFCDPCKDYKTILDVKGKDEIKKNLGIPTDKPIAFVSLRRADPHLTMFESNESFYNAAIKGIEKLKDKGFYIISRRRKGVDDLKVRRVNSPVHTKYEEFSKLIDFEMDGWDGFPSKIWIGCYICDVMLITDMTGLSRREGTIFETPILLTDYDEHVYNKNLNDKFGWDAGMKDLHNKQLMTNVHEEARTFINYSKPGKDSKVFISKKTQYKERMNKYKKDWHQGNGSKEMWDNVILDNWE